MTSSCATKCAINSGTAIIVTDAGRDSAILRKLVRRAIPMLIYPTAYPVTESEGIADALKAAVDGTFDGSLSEVA